MKIDAGLIRAVNASVSRQAVVVGLVHFAAVSGALVLAEGIETEAEQTTVQQLGVNLGQGYRFGRPAPIEAWARQNAVAPTTRPANVIPIRKPASSVSRGIRKDSLHSRAGGQQRQTQRHV